MVRFSTYASDMSVIICPHPHTAHTHSTHTHTPPMQIHNTHTCIRHLTLSTGAVIAAINTAENMPALKCCHILQWLTNQKHQAMGFWDHQLYWLYTNTHWYYFGCKCLIWTSLPAHVSTSVGVLCCSCLPKL